MKLLTKSIRLYSFYSVIILLIAVPAFYFVIKKIAAQDVDEDLRLQKSQVIRNLEKLTPLESYQYLTAVEPNISLSTYGHLRQKDTLYTASIYDSIAEEDVSYRILKSNVLIQGKPYLVTLKSSVVGNEELILSIVNVQAVLLLLIIGGLAIINHYYSKKLWKPFYNTLDRLHNYKIEKNESIQLDSTGIEEFTNLNQTINLLTHRNHQVYLSQKEFTENASHEMQSPLAVFKSKVELLMQTTPLTNEQAELIDELSQAGQRMNRLNKALLLLTKIDNNQFHEKERINVPQTVNNVMAQYRDALQRKQIRLENVVQSEIVIEANRTLIEILVSNLLSNAIRHNYREGLLRISFVESEMVIANEGKPESLDVSKLFQRFKKQTNDANSIGLGLEMARKICQLNDFQIAYRYQDSMHVFTINFKNR